MAKRREWLRGKHLEATERPWEGCHRDTLLLFSISCLVGRRLGTLVASGLMINRPLVFSGLVRRLASDEARDRSIAKHVMSVHINASGVNAGAQEGDIDIATMKKFVSYCRLKCAPRLSEAAATMLSSQVRALCRRMNSYGSAIAVAEHPLGKSKY